MPEPPQEISLLDSLQGNWFKLPLKAMREVGPAVQTLSALLNITSSQTFTATSEISKRARLPLKTVYKHLATLHEMGWIENKHREKTRSGWLRRTATLAVTKKTRDNMSPYGFLPWWAACHVGYERVRPGSRDRRHTEKVCGYLPWSCKAVLSVWFAEFLRLVSVVQEQDDFDESDLLGTMNLIENIGGQERFKFSLKNLTEQTGLSRETVVSAKRLLNHQFGILRWFGRPPEKGVGTPTDYLGPNHEFRVIVTPVTETTCKISFRKGSGNGQS